VPLRAKAYSLQNLTLAESLHGCQDLLLDRLSFAYRGHGLLDGKTSPHRLLGSLTDGDGRERRGRPGGLPFRAYRGQGQKEGYEIGLTHTLSLACQEALGRHRGKPIRFPHSGDGETRPAPSTSEAMGERMRSATARLDVSGCAGAVRAVPTGVQPRGRDHTWALGLWMATQARW
jgi:hypothetical protein